MEKPVLKRQITEMETLQGDQPTCYAHVSARLMIRNVLDMPNETKQWDRSCNQALNTQHLALDISKQKCGDHGYEKICLFLFFYYLARQYNPDARGGYPALTVRKFNDAFRHRHMPPEFSLPEYADIRRTTEAYFARRPVTQRVNVLEHVLYPNEALIFEEQTPLANLIVLFLQMNFYIGFTFLLKHHAVGHIITIIGYDTKKERFVCKDSEGGIVMMYSGQIGYFDSFTYKGHDLAYTNMKFTFAAPCTFKPLTKKVVLAIAKEFKTTYHYHDTNPFLEQETLDLPKKEDSEKEKEPVPEIICKKNQACPVPCTRATRHIPRTTTYCRKRRTKKVKN